MIRRVEPHTLPPSVWTRATISYGVPSCVRSGHCFLPSALICHTSGELEAWVAARRGHAPGLGMGWRLGLRGVACRRMSSQCVVFTWW